MRRYTNQRLPTYLPLSYLQASVLHGMVKGVSAFRPSHNKWRWWLQTTAPTGGLIFEAGFLGTVLHSSDELSKLYH